VVGPVNPEKGWLKMTDAAFVKKVRASLGLTQRQLAKRLFCSPRTIIRYENDEPVPHRIRLLLNLMLQEQRAAKTERSGFRR
jgi:transcriptional regulator with XRE-family HTH domain